ncbi:unnamed protein product [Ectocarpus sp. 12 AP-2014]
MALDALIYVGMLVFFCISVLLFEERESIDDEGAVIADAAITRAEFVFAVSLIAGICTEIREIRRGLADYMTDGWNCLDVLGLAVTLSGFGFRWADPSSPWGRSLYALGAPLLVSRILFFAQVLPFQGPMVQVLFLMMREMFRFAFVLLVVMLGFSWDSPSHFTPSSARMTHTVELASTSSKPCSVKLGFSSRSLKIDTRAVTSRWRRHCSWCTSSLSQSSCSTLPLRC